MEQGSSVRKNKTWWLAGAVLASVVLGILGWSLVASQQPTAQASGATQLTDDAVGSATTRPGTPGSASNSAGNGEQGKEAIPIGSVGDAGSRLPSPANPVATNAGGGVTVKVTWKGRQADDGAIAFLVVMDTHSVDLDGYDLSTMAVLLNDQGTEVAPLSWEAPPGGHHREGLLTFPATDGTGKPAIESGVQGVKLVIRGLAQVPERVLSWEVS